MAVCDILIIGSGIAGLSLAIKLNKEFPDRKIYIVTKECETQSSTRHAQGGISVVCDSNNDSFQSHVDDTLKAGAGLCTKEVVERVVDRAQYALYDLIENGTEFDRDSAGELALNREGGHSNARIVHYKDMTGFQIAVSLLVKVKTLPGIVLLSHHVAVDLITDECYGQAPENQSTCYGAIVFDKRKKRFENYVARVTVLATGGIGQVYNATTNPSIATGDGIAMAYRAGAAIKNMEFVQFHPTAFFLNDDTVRYFLITEALRGHGAYLRNVSGERFMSRYDSHGELACRDVVSRAIEDEMEISGHPCVYLDCRHLDPGVLKKAFPQVNGHCEEKGIDIGKDLIPVMPAAHYLCGGIEVNSSAMTSIDSLYAVGECSCTGLHGANRLASNSLLEAAVFADFAFQSIRSKIATAPIRLEPLKNKKNYQLVDTSSGIELIREKIRKLMTKYAGVLKSTSGLLHVSKYLSLLDEKFEEVYGGCFSPEIGELRNLIVCAKLIVMQSLKRGNNVGVFYNKDLDLNHTVDLNLPEIYL
jgi:L-aspartate oxidase